MNAFEAIATRQHNAIENFVRTLVELSGCSEAQARDVTHLYLRSKWAKLDSVGGRISVKHGAYLDTRAINRAIAITEEE